MRRPHRVRAEATRLGGGPAFLAGGIVGGVAAYLFDPDRGRQRRRAARDRTGAGIRHATRRAGRRAWATT